MSPADADLVEELLAAYGQLCKSRNYDAAFHILMAVLHMADRGEDMGLVDRVADMAAAQANEIDAIAPRLITYRPLRQQAGVRPRYSARSAPTPNRSKPAG